jgi:hypothetical protein
MENINPTYDLLIRERKAWVWEKIAYIYNYSGKVSKTNPVTGHGGPQGCETSRIPHFLDNRLIDGGEVVSLTRRPPFTPQEDSWYSFLLEAESTPGS